MADENAVVLDPPTVKETRELRDIPAAQRLNGTNYLKWSQVVKAFLGSIAVMAAVACSTSLDKHLYARGQETLKWSARQKIAVGAAKGLRYLHEECRVGCIVHRDMLPNNILITHDFEPLVGDFGLARWQPDGDMGVETRVIGTFGYLAPEYTQSGQITEKADVYSFGVVLVELITGRKAVDINRPKGQQCPKDVGGRHNYGLGTDISIKARQWQPEWKDTEGAVIANSSGR